MPDPQCGDGDCESCYAPACLDGDNDGYGDPGNGECFNGAALDCNDDNAAVNPGATEDLSDPASCADTIDNNCNGLIDEEEAGCIPTSTCAGSASASTGPTGTGGDNSGWYLFLLAGVVLIGVSAKRVFGHK